MTTKNYKEKLKEITTFVFDVDGVMSDGSVILLPPDHMMRIMNTRDGYAMKAALKAGYNMCVITGGTEEMVRYRLEYLGVHDVYIKIDDKDEVYEEYKKKRGITDDEVLYMGDDVPDYPVIKKAHVGACPKDACRDVLDIADYISPYMGGHGCIRDVIEQTMRVQGKWVVG